MNANESYITFKGEGFVKKQEMIEKARARAQENHVSGLNCGESTFRAILETLREAEMTDYPMKN